MRAEVMYGVTLLNDQGGLGAPLPRIATTCPGSGKLHVLVHAAPEWMGMARVATLCARRLK